MKIKKFNSDTDNVKLCTHRMHNSRINDTTINIHLFGIGNLIKEARQWYQLNCVRRVDTI